MERANSTENLLTSAIVMRPPNGLEMSRPACQGWYRAELDTRLVGSAPSSC